VGSVLVERGSNRLSTSPWTSMASFQVGISFHGRCRTSDREPNEPGKNRISWQGIGPINTL
jgi:hypothetical protein